MFCLNRVEKIFGYIDSLQSFKEQVAQISSIICMNVYSGGEKNSKYTLTISKKIECDVFRLFLLSNQKKSHIWESKICHLFGLQLINSFLLSYKIYEVSEIN